MALTEGQTPASTNHVVLGFISQLQSEDTGLETTHSFPATRVLLLGGALCWAPRRHAPPSQGASDRKQGDK